ncbi:MAG: response regulator [Chloroflexota bacterium]
MTPKRILYVEDNFQNRRLVKKILIAKGYEVIEASDGLQGIIMAEIEHPDLILMDINMPGLDGMEATAQLKSNPVLKSIPVIALTANAMRGDRERIMEAGCDEYLQKPINTVQLVQTIERFLKTPNGTTPPATPTSVSNEQKEQKAVPEIVQPATSNITLPVAPIVEIPSQLDPSGLPTLQHDYVTDEISQQTTAVSDSTEPVAPIAETPSQLDPSSIQNDRKVASEISQQPAE